MNMPRTIGVRTFALIAATALGAASANAATPYFEVELYRPSSALVELGVPADSVISRYFVTTDADIVSINNVRVSGGPLFSVPPPFGSIAEPPPPEFLPFDRRLVVDSWITTPGPTSLLGPDLPGDGTSTWGDLQNDGPQTRFWFAQLTAVPFFTFSGRVGLRVGGTPVNFDFSLPLPIDVPFEFLPVIPEPGALGLLAIACPAVLHWVRPLRRL
jgi:hypothetical protein